MMETQMYRFLAQQWHNGAEYLTSPFRSFGEATEFLRNAPSGASATTLRGMPYADLENAPPNIRDEFLKLPAKLNLFKMLANSRGTFSPLMSLVSAVFGKLDLDPSHREIAILFTASRTNAEYMWKQHLVIAPQTGVTPIQIEAIQRGQIEDAQVFDDREQLVLKMTEELLDAGEVLDSTVDRARARFSTAQIVEIILVVGFYRMLAGVMLSTELDLDVQASGDWTKRMAM
jgi:alkylhydroperoxidase family enzyme